MSHPVQKIDYPVSKIYYPNSNTDNVKYPVPEACHPNLGPNFSEYTAHTSQFRLILRSKYKILI